MTDMPLAPIVATVAANTGQKLNSTVSNAKSSKNASVVKHSTPATVKTASTSVTIPTDNEAHNESSSTSTNSLPADVVEFCNLQLKLLQKPIDMNLLVFCFYSVESSSEIREYFSDYYGSTPQVSKFATEFIKRKEALKSGGSGGKASAGNAGSSSVKGPKKREL